MPNDPRQELDILRNAEDKLMFDFAEYWQPFPPTMTIMLQGHEYNNSSHVYAISIRDSTMSLLIR